MTASATTSPSRRSPSRSATRHRHRQSDGISGEFRQPQHAGHGADQRLRSIVVNSTGNPLPTLVLDAGHPMPTAIMTLVQPDYTDSSDGVGDTFDASLYALSFWETVEGMHGHHPRHGRRRRLRLDLGRPALLPGLFASACRRRPDQQPRRLYHRRRSADRAARHGRDGRRHDHRRPPSLRRRHQSGHHRGRLHRLRRSTRRRASPAPSRWATISATSPASSSSTSSTANCTSPTSMPATFVNHTTTQEVTVLGDDAAA